MIFSQLVGMPKGFPDGNIDEPEHVSTMKLMIVYLSSIILSLIYIVEPVYNENLDNIKQMRESSAKWATGLTNVQVSPKISSTSTNQKLKLT